MTQECLAKRLHLRARSLHAQCPVLRSSFRGDHEDMTGIDRCWSLDLAILGISHEPRISLASGRRLVFLHSCLSDA